MAPASDSEPERTHVAEQMPDRPTEKHPIVTGLAALVGVALAVGLILGLVVLAGTSLLGLNGDDSVTEATSERSMYLPMPQKTPTPTGPQVTLPSQPSASPESSGSGDGEKEPKPERTPEPKISLSASTTSAAQMEQIDLTGVYPGGEGAILQVQRFTAGRWQDFPVTASVGNQTFSTYVQTSQVGVNRFRVIDTDSDRQSNEVRVTIR